MPEWINPPTIISDLDHLPHVWCICCDLSPPITVDQSRPTEVSEESEAVLLADDWKFINGRWICWCCQQNGSMSEYKKDEVEF